MSLLMSLRFLLRADFTGCSVGEGGAKGGTLDEGGGKAGGKPDFDSSNALGISAYKDSKPPSPPLLWRISLPAVPLPPPPLLLSADSARAGGEVMCACCGEDEEEVVVHSNSPSFRIPRRLRHDVKTLRKAL
jgi:hypothetical protein